MTDQEKREKVIEGLQEAVDWLSTETSLTVVDQWVVRDALALLKAQEAVGVQKKQMKMGGLQTWDWVCGNCGQTVLFSAKFCPWCGRAVKWE